MQVQAKLAMQFSQLKAYATSVNLSIVSIRLEDAQKAADTGDQMKFDLTARGIWDTLEHHYRTINGLRQRLLVPSFAT